MENQWISHVILQNHVRTLHQSMTQFSFNWYKGAL
jgi:hypothetical protein